jgi:hypothetical protein
MVPMLLEQRVRLMLSIVGLSTQLVFAPAGPIKTYITALLVVIITIDVLTIVLDGIKAVKIRITDLRNC